MTLQNRIKDFYTAYAPKEWRRLIRNAYHRQEFDTTLHFINRYVPAGSNILDAGGGPGRYTVALAQAGHTLTLLDFTPANLALARKKISRAKLTKQVKDITEGSIVDLSRYADAQFDAVLCLGGPFSHVTAAAYRQKAASELVRVVKPGGHVFVSVMSRISVIQTILWMAPEELEMPHYKLILETGEYEGENGFTACHFFYPEEFKQYFDQPGFEVLTMAGLEGIASGQRKAYHRMAKNPQQLKIWQETHLQTCTHPAVVGCSEHMLLVGRKH